MYVILSDSVEGCFVVVAFFFLGGGVSEWGCTHVIQLFLMSDHNPFVY